MKKPLIHFAHANGIPSKCYQVLFDALSDEFEICYLPELGTNPKYPVDNHWQSLTKQVIDSIEENLAKHGQKQLIGLGHSLGALCTLQAGYRKPELFSQIITLDPPLIHGKLSLVLHLAKMSNQKLVDKITPAGISKHRRDTWDNREQAHQLLRQKAFYKNFHDQCFDDYIQHGLKDTPDGKVTLTIPKDVEVAVFRNNPSYFWLKPNHPPKVPAKQIIGKDSLFIKRGFPQIVKQRMGIDFELHDGGHMFPLEHPNEVAKRIKAIIHQQIPSNHHVRQVKTY